MATMTKAQLVNENIDLRAQLDKLRAQAAPGSVASKPVTTLRARFCGAYCRKHNVRSVPPGVFETWLESYRAQ